MSSVDLVRRDAGEFDGNRPETMVFRRGTVEAEGRREESWRLRTAGGGAGDLDFGGTLVVAHAGKKRFIYFIARLWPE
jgi:hypothetical protein